MTTEVTAVDIIQSNCCFNNYSNHRKVCWVVTNTCSLKCKHCAQLSNPIMLANFNPLKKKNILKIIHTLKDLHVEKVIISGGEPTEYRHLLNVFDGLRENNISFSMSTNGNSKRKIDYKHFKCHGLENITISLDGYNSLIHDKVRGKGSFSKVIDSIKNAVESGIKITVASFLHEENSKHIAELIDLCNDLKINELNLLAPINYNQCKIQHSDFILNKQTVLTVLLDAMRSVENKRFEIAVRFPECEHDQCPSGNNISGVFGESIINHCVFKHYTNNLMVV